MGELVTIGKENDLLDRLSHFVLPALILGSRQRGAADALHASEHAWRRWAPTTSRPRSSKGLPSRVVVVRHGLRNALIPVITVLAFLMPGAHRRAPWSPRRCSTGPGLGQLSVKAAKAGDPAMMMGVVLIVGIAVLARLDRRRPRLRHRRSAHPLRPWTLRWAR
ncbi:MAG: hypothetical protein V9G19_14875 [Tetrasphaera sp.]